MTEQWPSIPRQSFPSFFSSPIIGWRLRRISCAEDWRKSICEEDRYLRGADGQVTCHSTAESMDNKPWRSKRSQDNLRNIATNANKIGSSWTVRVSWTRTRHSEGIGRPDHMQLRRSPFTYTSKWINPVREAISTVVVNFVSYSWFLHSRHLVT